MKKVLVIGGLGFLGSQIAEELIKLDYKVTIFDISNADFKKDNYEYICGDILNIEILNTAIAKADIVYHTAGISDIDEADKNPVDTVNFNVLGSLNIINLCNKYSVKLMFASTVYVYSKYGSFYRASKQSVETILEVFGQKFDLNYTILRYGSLYGPKAQNWNGVKKHILNMIDNNKIIVAGTGQERREFIHVKDAAKLSILSLEDKYKHKAVSITGIQVLTQSELLSIIGEILDKDIKIDFDHDSRSRDHYQLTPYQYTPKHSIKLISNEYIDIGQGILEVIEEIKSQK